MEVGEKEIIYLSLHCHHQNDSCIKVGSDESHFNVSLIVRDKTSQLRRCPQTTAFLKRNDSWSSVEPRTFCLTNMMAVTITVLVGTAENLSLLITSGESLAAGGFVDSSVSCHN